MHEIRTMMLIVRVVMRKHFGTIINHLRELLRHHSRIAKRAIAHAKHRNDLFGDSQRKAKKMAKRRKESAGRYIVCNDRKATREPLQRKEKVIKKREKREENVSKCPPKSG